MSLYPAKSGARGASQRIPNGRRLVALALSQQRSSGNEISRGTLMNWRELAHQRKQLHERATALANKADQTAADRSEIDRLLQQMDGLAEQIARMTRTDALAV